MNNIQTILKRYFAICIGLQFFAIAFMTIPWFEGYREVASSIFGASPSDLWLPIALFLIVTLFAVSRRLVSVIAKPVNALIRDAQLGESEDSAFKKKSRLQEEDDLKHFLETHTVRMEEANQLLKQLEIEVRETKRELATAQAACERQERDLKEVEQLNRDLRVKTKELDAENAVLESTLASERKTKVGREVKMRAEEIYAQMERAVAEASARSIWIPNLISQLKVPTSAIQDLSKRLKSTWNETSLARVGEEIAEIHRQSNIQISLLNNLKPEDLINPENVPSPAESKPLKIEEKIEKEVAPEPEPKKKATETVIEAIPANETEESDPKPKVKSIIEPPSKRKNKPQDTSAEDAFFASLVPKRETDSNQPMDDAMKEVFEAYERSHRQSVVIGEESFTANEESTNTPREAESTEVEPSKEENSKTKPSLRLETDSNSVIELAPSSEIDDLEAVDTNRISALQTLVFELVNDYSKEVENVTVDAEFSEDVEIDEIDEELLESVLSNLLEIAIYQWKEGSVQLNVSQRDGHITFAVDSKGKPLEYGELDENQSNRIASALDRKITVDMPSDNELRMRYKYVHHEP